MVASAPFTTYPAARHRCRQRAESCRLNSPVYAMIKAWQALQSCDRHRDEKLSTGQDSDFGTKKAGIRDSGHFNEIHRDSTQPCCGEQLANNVRLEIGELIESSMDSESDSEEGEKTGFSKKTWILVEKRVFRREKSRARGGEKTGISE